MRIARNVAATLAVVGSGYLLLVAWAVAGNLSDRAKGGPIYFLPSRPITMLVVCLTFGLALPFVSLQLATPRGGNYAGRVMIAFACALVAAFLVLAVAYALSDAGISFLAHFHRHGHVDPRAIVSLLDEAGLRCVDSGAVSISSL
jgi:hypothetical protein